MIGELGLAALCRASPPMVLQLLRTLLWHLDRIPDHLPRLPRAAAIAMVSDAFRAEWSVDRAGWEEVLALLQGLGDLPNMRRDELRGHLNSREWHEAQRIAALLPHLQPLAEVIRRLGRAEAHPGQAPTPQPQPLPRASRAQPVTLRETRLGDAPGELKGIRHSDRIERMLSSEALQIRHPVLHKLWRARLAESRLLTYESEAVLLEAVPDPAARQPPQAAATIDAIAAARPDAGLRRHLGLDARRAREHRQGGGARGAARGTARATRPAA